MKTKEMILAIKALEKEVAELKKYVGLSDKTDNGHGSDKGGQKNKDKD